MNILITGASSGLGKEMTLYLKNQGHKIYAVARDKKKLDKIYKKYECIKTLEFDLRDPDNCCKLYNKLKNKDIDILINNAGFGDSGNFSDTSLNKELDMIDLNIKAYHILTKLFLKEFIKKDRGKILNVASIAGFMPGPYMATYYATKSYILNLTLAINEELRQQKSNVKISIFCPGPIKTNFEQVANVKFNISLLDSKYAAKYAIDAMNRDKLLIIPPNMRLNRLLIKLAPTKLTLLINSNIQESK
jgi:hypothetical protein